MAMPTLRSCENGKKQSQGTCTGRLLLFSWTVLAVACAPPLTKVCKSLVPEPPPTPGTVQVSFLGVGGVIIRWQGQAIMTAPLYSNPTVAEMALSEIHVDRQRVNELMRESLHDVKDVRAILAGHSHYDHLLEVPYIALHRAPSAEILGNNAMVKLLDPIAKAPSSRTLVSLESPASPVHDVPGTRFRIRSVVSQHSPQIGPRLEKRVAGIFAPLLPLSEVSLWRGEDEYP